MKVIVMQDRIEIPDATPEEVFKLMKLQQQEKERQAFQGLELTELHLKPYYFPWWEQTQNVSTDTE